MLPYPKLNDQEAQTVLAAALDELRIEEGDWNLTSISDPGVFLLELFAQLKCKQQSYIDQVGAKSFYKFAALLGLALEKAKAAKTYLCFYSKESVELLEDTRLMAKDLIFETTKRFQVQPNKVIALGYERQQMIELQPFDPDRMKEGYDFLPYRKGGGVTYFILERLLPKNEPIRFFIQLAKEEIPRTPITNPENFVPLSKVVWEYYGCFENGQDGWQPMEVLQDETMAFLFSGQFIGKVSGIHKVYQGKSMIRIRTITYGYEFEPKLLKIRLNCVPAVQCRTLCKPLQFTVKQLRENQMFLETALAAQDCYQLYIRQKEKYLTAESLGITYLIKETNCRFQLGTSDRKQLLERFQLEEPESIALFLVVYDKEFYPKRFLGSGTGISHQTIQLEVSDTLLSDSLQLFVWNEGGWELWRQVSSFDSAKETDSVYTFLEREKTIMFGDNIHGKTPSLGTNTICLIGGKVTAAKEGNIREGMIQNWFEKPSDFLQVEQFLEAAGGREEETKEALQRRVRLEKQRQLRAVTAEDYEQLAKKTQGLKLSRISAISLYRPGLVGYPNTVEENAVTLIIEAAHDPALPFPKEAYLENVRRHLEPYRLLTTRLYFMMSQYFGLELDGELIVNGGYETARKAVETVLEEYLLERQETLGEIISHGDLCGRLERLNCIEQVKYLQMEFSPSTARNSLGDLFVPPYGRVYLKQNRLDFQKYTEGR